MSRAIRGSRPGGTLGLTDSIWVRSAAVDAALLKKTHTTSTARTVKANRA